MWDFRGSSTQAAPCARRDGRDRRPHGQLYEQPWQLTPRVWEHFTDEGSILEELQRDWRTSLAGEVYVAIEAGQGDLQADVMKAFTTVSRRHAHARRILEAHADHPAIAAAMRKERALLASFGALVGAAASFGEAAPAAA